MSLWTTPAGSPRFWWIALLGVCMVGLIGWGMSESSKWEEVCPDGYTLIGERSSKVGVGPNVGGDGGVAVVVVPSDTRTCIGVFNGEIRETEIVRVRK